MMAPMPRRTTLAAPRPRDERARDRRTERTHRALREALFAAAREDAFDDVSVQALCDRANVGRSTFYAHFADKEDLLMSGFAELGRAFRDRDDHGSGELRFVLPMLEHVRDHWWLFRKLRCSRSGALVRDRLLAVVADLVGDELRAAAPDGPLRDHAARYVAAAFVETARFWLDEDNRRPADQVAAAFAALTAPLLATMQSTAGARP